MKKTTRFRPQIESLEDRTVPANYTVNTSVELVAAINAANLTPEADIITLAAGNNFNLTVVNNNANGPTGLPVIVAGENLTIIGNGDKIERSTRQGTPAFRLFDVAVGATLTLQDLTVQGGQAFGLGIQAQGGAIRNLGELNLDGVTISRNSANGLSGTNGYSGESAFGGGIYSNGTINVVNSHIDSNVVIGGSGHDAYRSVNVHTGQVFYNSATTGGDALGGGIYVAGGLALIRDTTITGNNAVAGDGGNGMIGISYYGGTEYILPGATGGNAGGGGLCFAGGAASVQGVTVTSNQAKGGTGGAGVRGQGRGADGSGLGGGIFIAPEALIDIDTYTQTHARKNHASTADDNISGL